MADEGLRIEDSAFRVVLVHHLIPFSQFPLSFCRCLGCTRRSDTDEAWQQLQLLLANLIQIETVEKTTDRQSDLSFSLGCRVALLAMCHHN